MAVLGAATRLEADDALDLDLGATPLHPDLVRECEQLLEALIGKLEHAQDLILRQAHPLLEHLLTGGSQYVAIRIARGGCFGCLSHAALLTRSKPDTQS